jgi:hypothetical protein
MDNSHLGYIKKKLLTKSTDLDRPFFVGNISPKIEIKKIKN